MSLRDAVQNAASPTFTSTLVCTLTIIVLACYCMSRHNALTIHLGLVLRLLLELTLLASVSFLAAIIVLSTFHARFEQYTQYPSQSNTGVERELLSPLELTRARVG